MDTEPQPESAVKPGTARPAWYPSNTELTTLGEFDVLMTIATKGGVYRWVRNDGEFVSPEFTSYEECFQWNGPKLSVSELAKLGALW